MSVIVFTSVVEPNEADRRQNAENVGSLLPNPHGTGEARAGDQCESASIRDPTRIHIAEIIFAILGVAAKLERRRILERTARGRADAKERGVKFGRKPILTPHQQKEARKRLDAGET